MYRKSPDTKIYVRTILPSRKSDLKNDIILVNDIIKSNRLKGHYQVIDLYTHFVDSSGELIKELTEDGVHLNDKGYERWVNFEKPIIESLNNCQN